MRRRFSLLVWLALLAAAVCARADDRPNILWIVSDDQGYGDLSSMGHPALKTPRLDRLRQESVWLRNFYVAPLCAPTRAALLTGRHNLRTGVWDTWASRSNLAVSETTIADDLVAAGYTTAQFGKWHLGENHPFRPIDRGFNHAFVWNNLDRFAPTFSKDGATTDPYPGFLDNVVTDEAIRFLRSPHAKPFFAYVALFLPHTFWGEQVPEADVERFADVDRLSAKDREVMGMLENVDRNVGRLLDALREAGLDDNTIVVFHSDNGLTSRQQSTARFNAGLRGTKGQVYEGGIRVPAFVRWANRLQPRTDLNRVGAVDLLPTLLEATGVPHRGPRTDGISLWPLLSGTATTINPRYIFQQQQPQRSGKEPQPFVNAAVVGHRYKLVFVDGEDAPELYDLERDEGETTNISAEQPQRVAEMKAAYLTWFEDVSRERGFRPQPVVIGSPAQPIFRESMIQVPETTGLPVVIARAGEYLIRLRLVQTSLFPQGGYLGLTDGQQIWRATVNADTEEVRLRVQLPAGPLTLKPWSQGKQSREGYLVTGDPGCREIFIEPIGFNPPQAHLSP